MNWKRLPGGDVVNLAGVWRVRFEPELEGRRDYTDVLYLTFSDGREAVLHGRDAKAIWDHIQTEANAEPGG